MSQPGFVLVSEDEALVRLVVEEYLTDAGFEVMIASNGTEAIAKLEAGTGEIRALVTDVHLGKGPTGWEVAHRARELLPDLPVIYMTAAGGPEWSANGVPNSVLIAKPFAGAQLVTALSTLLNDAAILKAQNS
jgi:CheY-like chemotaxis protein